MFENTPEITSKRLFLRKFTKDDINDIFLIYSDEETNKYLPWFPIKTFKDAYEYLHNKILPCYKEQTAYNYAISLKTDNHVIGYIYIADIGNANDLGYALKKEFWHKGYTSEACSALIDKLIKSQLTHITATHDINNPYSGSVMKKIGLSYKYSYKEQWLPKDILVTFRMYQLNFNQQDKSTYKKYWLKSKEHYIEDELTCRTQLQKELFELQDLKYHDFQSSLIPNIKKDAFIGIRIPVLRTFAKNFKKNPNSAEFLKSLPHKYLEENNLHGFLIENIKDYDSCILAIEELLPFIDNWATCDSIAPKIFKNHLPELLEKIKIWIKSSHTYTIRFGIIMLMRFYLNDAFDVKYPELITNIKTDEYYVQMMIAWYFATALAKQYESIVPFIEQHKLNVFTHNKTIQKAIESFRITPEQKAYLRTLKTKSAPSSKRTPRLAQINLLQRKLI